MAQSDAGWSPCLTEDQVASFWAGRLTLSECAAVEGHCQLCPACDALLLSFGLPPTGRIASAVGSPSALSATFEIGEVVANRFRVLRFIAEGGMGEVYEVEDALFLGEHVALKTVCAHLTEDACCIERFMREVRLARRITHCHVSRVFDIGKFERAGETIHYLTMELLRGETLGQRVRRGGPLPQREACVIALQIAQALAAAHDQGVVHRDLKSDNVVLAAADQSSATERIVVTDFGLARDIRAEVSACTPASGLVGTVGYAAPEQLRGCRATPASDLYALGVILFEMLAGRLPFRGRTLAEIVACQLAGKRERLGRAAPGVDVALEHLVDRCLAYRPGQRFASAEVFADVLVSWLNGGKTRFTRLSPSLPSGAHGAASPELFALTQSALADTHEAAVQIRRVIAVSETTMPPAMPET